MYAVPYRAPTVGSPPGVDPATQKIVRRAAKLTIGTVGVVPGRLRTEHGAARTYAQLEADEEGHAAIKRCVKDIRAAIGGGYFRNIPGSVIRDDLEECVVSLSHPLFCFVLRLRGRGPAEGSALCDEVRSHLQGLQDAAQDYHPAGGDPGRQECAPVIPGR